MHDVLSNIIVKMVMWKDCDMTCVMGLTTVLEITSIVSPAFVTTDQLQAQLVSDLHNHEINNYHNKIQFTCLQIPFPVV